jgi:hypothetical protein
MGNILPLSDTNIDDSNEWNGSEMEDFGLDESDLIDELKLNDITHVTTPHDNKSNEVDMFHSTDLYYDMIEKLDDLSKQNAFNIKHIGKNNGGVYHLKIDSTKFRKP